MGTFVDSESIPAWLREGCRVWWRHPAHANAIGWLDVFGEGPFEVVRFHGHRAEDLPPTVILRTRIGEAEINALWLAPSDPAVTAAGEQPGPWA
jgi:hypothetical protein